MKQILVLGDVKSKLANLNKNLLVWESAGFDFYQVIFCMFVCILIYQPFVSIPFSPPLQFATAAQPELAAAHPLHLCGAGSPQQALHTHTGRPGQREAHYCLCQGHTYRSQVKLITFYLAYIVFTHHH